MQIKNYAILGIRSGRESTLYNAAILYYKECPQDRTQIGFVETFSSIYGKNVILFSEI